MAKRAETAKVIREHDDLRPDSASAMRQTMSSGPDLSPVVYDSGPGLCWNVRQAIAHVEPMNCRPEATTVATRAANPSHTSLQNAPWSCQAKRLRPQIVQ